MKISKRDEILSDIEQTQRELNKLLQENNYQNTEIVLEKSRALDEMIVAFYDLMQEKESK